MSEIVVMGAGRSGVAAANFLARRGDSVLLADSAPESAIALREEIDPAVETRFGVDALPLDGDVTMVVLSPGVPRSAAILAPALERGVPVIAEVEIAFRELRGRVIGITGSNGKSTTTTLVGEILREAGREPIVAGNIGTALVAAIDPSRQRDYVVELSSFQLESIDTFRADVALLLNITPDHMDRYASLEDYAAAKYRILENQDSDAIAVLNADDERTANAPARGQVWRFSVRQPVIPGAWLTSDRMVLDVGEGESEMPRETLTLQGIANVQNALAAWLAARAVGVTDDAVMRAFRSFRGLPHRMEIVRDRDGIVWVNDSKGTNVDATFRSLEGQPDSRVILILGGRDKEGEFARLRPLIERKVRTLLTIGEAAVSIAEALEGTAPIVEAGTLEEAVRLADEKALEGDVVLLSPACASFDQFRNFEHRGDRFRELVTALGGESQ